MSMRYRAPLDPECSQVRVFLDQLFDDPMTEAMGAPTDDIVEGFERRHRRLCKRCQEYGAAKYRGAAVMTPKYPDITVQLVGQRWQCLRHHGVGSRKRCASMASTARRSISS